MRAGPAGRGRVGVRWCAGEFADAYLLKRPASPGYSVVVFRGRHVPDPALFTDAEVTGYWSAVRTVGAAIHRVYAPAQINYQCMNNSVAHVHTHVLPRYLDDPGPRTMLPDGAFANARSLGQAELQAQLARLKTALLQAG